MSKIPNMIKGGASNYGAFLPVLDADGNVVRYEVLVNKETSMRDGMFHTGAHEFLHAALYNTLMKDGKTQTIMGKALQSALKDKGVKWKKGSDLMNRIDSYRPEEGQGEEIMALSSEALLNNEFTMPSSIVDRIKDTFRRFAQNHLNRDIKFDTDQDVLNFWKDYNHSVKNNVTNKAIIRMAARGATGKLIAKAQAEAKKRKQVEKDPSAAFSKRTVLQEMHEKFEGNKRRMVSEGFSRTKAGDITTDISQSELGDALGPIIESITQRLFDPIPVSERNNVTRDEYKMALNAMAGNLIETEYDPTKQKLDKFVSTRLNLRAEALAKDLGVKQVFTEDIEGKTDLAIEEDIELEDAREGLSLIHI